MLLPEPLGKPGGLFAEKQPASILKMGAGVVLGGFGGGQPQVGVGVFRKKVVQAVVHMQVHHGPVVQPRPFDRLFADVEAQGLNEMEAAPGGGAGAGDVAAVLRDLRFHQYNVQQSKPSSHIGSHCIPNGGEIQL